MRKIIIIHDQSEHLPLLQHYLGNMQGIAVTGIFSSVSEAAAALKTMRFDVLLAGEAALLQLDKEKMSALWVCLEGPGHAALPPEKQQHIFAYLQVPFSFERIFALFQHIELYLQQQTHQQAVKWDFIFIKSEYKLIKINLSDILFLSGLRDYTQIFLKGKISPLTTLQNLKDFESKLPVNSFIRVHRSYIVSLSQVDAISRNEITIGTYTIPIGHAYRQLLDEMITKNS
jgi:DNA-binding LytR/AlgR family response regulator